MTTLRKQIESILCQWEDSPNGSANAAFFVCVLLNEKYDLSKQGHFDDDPELTDALLKGFEREGDVV
ncbi:hypothetical protein [Pseudomonas syringae]|uniref:hypothetical protein n=1 Tax=Pseudomonas syringae TaxID=317 RepID=UPI002009F02D|nr:hypothetical protein [Pseudomonas syringae]MCK9709880.1 hypothetical protein [Pseudomonas syringae pv. syringae]